MDQKSLEKNLANIERELLNLQTAHDIGLGVIKYYQYNGVVNSKTQARLKITVQTGEKPFPFLLVAMKRASRWLQQYNLVAPLDEYGMEFLAISGELGESDTYWKIISTSKVSVEDLS